eukprot:7548711-Karenia_brevis.AAC.1
MNDQLAMLGKDAKDVQGGPDAGSGKGTDSLQQYVGKVIDLVHIDGKGQLLHAGHSGIYIRKVRDIVNCSGQQGDKEGFLRITTHDHRNKYGRPVFGW